MTEPRDLSPLLVQAVEKLGLEVAFTISTETTEAIFDVIQDNDHEIMLNDGSHLQIVDSMSDIIRTGLSHVGRLQHAALLKEAQVLSYEMEKPVTFQFCVLDVGHEFGSSYDLVLNGVSVEDDEDLETAPKPCIGVRVIDYKSSVINIWSLNKLRKRVRLMRQLYQYIDSPQYSQHFNLDNPFSESCLPLRPWCCRGVRRRRASSSSLPASRCSSPAKAWRMAPGSP